MSATLRSTLATDEGLLPGWLTIADGVITELGTGEPPSADVIDLRGYTIAPGFIDVHVHGGDGGQAAGDDPAMVSREVIRAAHFHAQHGTTRMLATTVSDTPERLLTTVSGIRLAMDARYPETASIAGIHLEGPWLAPARRGAHDPNVLRDPEVRELDNLMQACDNAIRLITMAPELPGADALIKAALSSGVVVSVGHTEATYDQARRAFELGASHLTHLGNAMPPLDRRDPGPIGAALTDDNVSFEVIADGEHVHPAMLKLVSAAAPGRMVAITDAIAATGLPDGEYMLGELPVLVACGRAVLADSPQTLAGSVLTMDRAVAKLIESGVAAPEALAAATLAPARVLGEAAERGRLRPGYTADLVVLDQDWRASATLINGRVAHDPAALLASL